ncbi:MAG TPA: metallophosphoesterase family protein [Thermoanaerobaculia bacterium]|nr:metallophosphoesterase family protein [Thermoanaerobaculia bacterium]
MPTILHLSDLHFGPPFVPRVAEAFLRIAPTLSADAVVVSGDFTQRARPEQFAEARAFLDRLPDLPRIEVPGNHDVPLYRAWERVTDPLGHYKRWISPELDRVLEIPGAVLVGLDTTSPRRTVTRGKIEREQVAFVREALAEAPPGVARIVVVHHHFMDAPDALNDRGMVGGEWAMTRFIEMGVDMILGGHLHRAFIGNSLDFYFAAPRDRGIILVQCGTTTSRRGRGRERERNTFNLVELHDDWLEITHYLYFEQDDAFGPISGHVFPRAGRRLLSTASRQRLESGLWPAPA